MTKKEACLLVANDWRKMTGRIYIENDYAEHVTDEYKLAEYNKGMEYAKEIEKGIIDTFTIWQRVNYYITGECVPLFKE